MSRARKASAATSLPKAGAFTPAGNGRSRGPISALARARRAVASCRGVVIARAFRRTREAYPSRSRGLAQPGKHGEPGVAVGRTHADGALERPHGLIGGAPHAAIGATGVEAERGQPALNLLHLGERGGTLAARELLHERAAAAQAGGGG